MEYTLEQQKAIALAQARKRMAEQRNAMPQQGNAGSAGRAFAYGVTGGQIPFGNVIASGIGAGIAKAANSELAPIARALAQLNPLTALISKAIPIGSPSDARSFGQLYEQAQADTKATQEASPTAALLGNLAGIATTLPAAFSKPVQGSGILATPARGLQNFGSEIAKVASSTPFKGAGIGAGLGNLGARMAGGAAVAAPLGGLYAAGEADSGQRGDAFQQGALLSGGIGGALPLVGRALSPVISKVEEKLAQRAMKAQLAGAPVADDLANSALDKVMARLKADYPDPNDLQNVLNKFTYGNKTLAELGGERTTNLAKGAAQYPTGEAVTKEMFMPRVEKAAENIKKSASKYVSGKTDYYDTLDDVLEKGQAAAKPLYDEAYKFNQSISSREIDNILSTPAGKKALSDARVIMQNDRSLMGLPDKELGDLAKELQSMGMMAETQGGVASGLKLRTLDYVKKALDDQYQGAVRAGEKSNARAILGLKQGLVSELDSADTTGLYSKARKTAGDYLSSQKAMELGTTYKKIDAPLLKRQIQDMSTAERNAFKVGVVKSIRDDIDAVNEGGNIYQRVFGKAERKNQLKEILGNDFDKFQKEILEEDKIFKIRNEVLANSATASKQKAAQEFESIARDYVQDVATMGTATGTATAAIRATKIFINKMFDGVSDKAAGDVAKILYTNDAREKIKIINALRKTGVSPQDKKALEAYFILSDVLKRKKKLPDVNIKNVSPMLQPNLNNILSPATAPITSGMLGGYLATE